MGMGGMPGGMPGMGMPQAPNPMMPGGFPGMPGVQMPGPPSMGGMGDPLATHIPTPFLGVNGMITADVLATDEEYKEVRNDSAIQPGGSILVTELAWRGCVKSTPALHLWVSLLGVAWQARQQGVAAVAVALELCSTFMTWHLTWPASLPACCAALHMLWLLSTLLSRLLHGLRCVCVRFGGIVLGVLVWCGVFRPSACPPACLPASAACLLFRLHACFVALLRLHCPCCTALLRLLPLCLLDPCPPSCAPSHFPVNPSRHARQPPHIIIVAVGHASICATGVTRMRVG